MAKDQRSKQKQLKRKAAKHKAKRDLQKKKELLKAQNSPEIILDKVDHALELAEQGEMDGALQILRKLKKKHSANVDVQFGLGVMAMHAKNYDEAIELFDRTIEADPFYIKAHFNRAGAYQQQMNIRHTVESLKKVIELRQHDAELADQAQEQLNSLSDAIGGSGGVSLDQFVEAQTSFDLGCDFMEQQDFEKAVDPLKKALSLNPDPPQSHGNLGLCYAFLGEKELALGCLNKAVELDPEYKVALSNKAMIEKLEPGEKLDFAKFKSVNYYLDHLKPEAENE